MVNEAQLTYEHSNGVTMDFLTNDLVITWTRPTLRIDARPDGVLQVTDAGVYQRVFTCSAILTAANVSTINGWLVAAITYSGAYPRLTKVYLTGATLLADTGTEIEVAITSFSARMVADGRWNVQVTFTEKAS